MLATRYFARWAKHEKASNKKILKAIEELQNGLNDGNLGGDIYKKRIGINNRGRRDGGRAIITFKIESSIFCLYAYPKNKKEDITDDELTAFQENAKYYFSLNETVIDELVKNKKLIEVYDEKKTH
ncbi:MAG: type II toxin-antitoxin system RelE/ParE family toxin [Gammaproteobacteria bacterium]|nr:type II toxin-antitoxin system RelE/ParE family toxin [Gammaproteobacteria bacterium]